MGSSSCGELKLIRPPPGYLLSTTYKEDQKKMLALLALASAVSALPQYAPAPAPPAYVPAPVPAYVPAPVAKHDKAHINPDLAELSPYTFNYAVADDYSKANFNAAESDDGTGAREGSYSVILPDGRIQHVHYTTNDYDGYVAEVTYEGEAQYPPEGTYHVKKPAYGAPPPAYGPPLVPVPAPYGAPAVHKSVGPVVHQSHPAVVHQSHPAVPVVLPVAHPAVDHHHV